MVILRENREIFFFLLIFVILIPGCAEPEQIEFETREDEMQEYADWPGVKPKPMDPLHVLEDDEYIQELKNGLHKDETVHVEVKLDSSGETNGSY